MRKVDALCREVPSHVGIQECGDNHEGRLAEFGLSGLVLQGDECSELKNDFEARLLRHLIV